MCIAESLRSGFGDLRVTRKKGISFKWSLRREDCEQLYFIYLAAGGNENILQTLGPVFSRHQFARPTPGQGEEKNVQTGKLSLFFYATGLISKHSVKLLSDLT